MAQQRRKKKSEVRREVHEFEYRRHQVRIEESDAERLGEDEGGREAKLFIDDIEIPIEVTPRGVVSHDEMAFKEYGTVEELAEDIIRQRGTAEIVKGEAPPGHHDSPH
jgi:hypothetical protein